MGSKRLPNKSMKLLTSNYRLIDFTILNALGSKYLNKKNIFLLTSKKKENLKLVNHVKKKYKIQIVEGSELNVFSRYSLFKSLKNFPLLRLTADNPLIDPLLIDRFVDYFKKSKSDYLTTRAMSHSKVWKIKSDFQKGVSLEIFNSDKLFINNKKFNINNQDSPTWFFFNKMFKAKIKKFPSFSFYRKNKHNLSLTIDTKEDFLRVKKFMKQNKCTPGTNNVYKYYKKNYYTS